MNDHLRYAYTMSKSKRPSHSGGGSAATGKAVATKETAKKENNEGKTENKKDEEEEDDDDYKPIMPRREERKPKEKTSSNCDWESSYPVEMIYRLGKNVVNQRHYDLMKKLCKLSRDQLLHPDVSTTQFLQQNSVQVNDVIEEEITLNEASGAKTIVHRCYVTVRKAEHLSPVGWVLNHPCKHCLVCKQRFHVSRWKHHCRDCGSIVCQYCTVRHADYYDCFIRCKQCANNSHVTNTSSNTSSHTSDNTSAVSPPPISMSAKTCSGDDISSTGSTRELSDSGLGMTLPLLAYFIRQHRVSALRGLTTREVCDIIVKPMTKASHVSLCQLLHARHPAHIRPATVHVIHAWSQLFLETVDAVFSQLGQTHLLDGVGENDEELLLGGDDDVVVWIDIFSFNQHESLSVVSEDDDDFSSQFLASLLPLRFKNPITTALIALTHWENPLPFKRAWCLWEIFSAATSPDHLNVKCAMSEKEWACLLRGLRHDSHMVLQRFLSHLDSQRSECSEETDRIALHRQMRGVGYDAVNLRILHLLRAQLMTLLEVELDKLRHLDMTAPPRTGIHNISPIAADNNTTVSHLPRHRHSHFYTSSTSSEEVEVCDEVARMSFLHGLALLAHDQGDDVSATEFTNRLLNDKRSYYGEHHLETLSTMNELALLYREHQQPHLSLPLLQEVAQMREHLLGPLHPLTLQAMTHEASCQTLLHHYSEAEGVYEEVVRRKKEVYGNDVCQHDLLLLMTQLASLYERQERGQGQDLNRALSLYDVVYDSWRRLLGEHHPFALTALSHRISILERLGHTAQADALTEDLLQRHARYIHHRDYQDTLTSLQDLAHIYEIEGKLGQAERLYEMVSERLEELTTSDCEAVPETETDALTSPPHTPTTPGNLNTATTSSSSSYSHDHKKDRREQRSSLNALTHLANVYEREGKYAMAENTLRKLLEKARQVYGDSDIQTCVIENNLALLYKQEKKYDVARDMLVTLTDRLLHSHAYLQHLLDHHSSTSEEVCEVEKEVVEEVEKARVWELLLTCMNNLGSIYEGQGDWALAHDYYVRTLQQSDALTQHLLEGEGEKEARSIVTSLRIQCVNHLAQLLETQGCYSESESYYSLALQLRRETLGSDHSDTLRSMNNLAVLYTRRGKLAEAQELYEQVLQQRRALFGKQHPATLQTMLNLAACLKEQGRLKEAQSLLKEVVMVRRRVLGDKHSDTIQSLNLLAIVIAQLNKE